MREFLAINRGVEIILIWVPAALVAVLAIALILKDRRDRKGK